MQATLLTFSILTMIFLPLLAGALLRRRFVTPWMWLCAGMLTFTLSQAVHIPLNEWLAKVGWLQAPGLPESQPAWQTALILGLTAGLCEELARAGGYALLKKARSLPAGLMLGLGHGGIEAMVFGGVLTAATVGALLPILQQGLEASPYADLPLAQAQAIESQVELLLSSPWVGLAPLVERVVAMGLHISLSVMVLKTFQRGNPAWLLLAIVYHAVVDFAAVMARNSTQNAFALIAGFLLISLPGLLWLAWTVRKEAPASALQPNPLQRELHLFWAALQKELLQLWRTQRILLIAVVFGVFGFTSPLLAYFTPEMLRMIPGAEVFADLVPTPTTGDAMLQYHKNLTQFAFLLAVIFGMGSVAGEKERGSATLVLSKPLPRWAFLAAKLAAQSLLFSFGFLLGSLGGYFYTVILFGGLDPGAFVLMNLVLIAWVMPFIALTLVGSVLGNSTTAAGGISLALVIGLMLLGGIPPVSALMPTALSGWAAQLGALAAGVAASSPGSVPVPEGILPLNLGALASAFTLVTVCLAVSLGLFERQEL